MSNFSFLKNTDNDLYKLISEAEKLYRDEYFEQCMTQARRFGENVCKKMLKSGGKVFVKDETFDEMLSTLKDKPNPNAREKEFLDDLYFLKREGNSSTHSLSVKKDAITALECLKRAFEISINYTLAKSGQNPKIDAMQFDEELLVLGTKNKKISLKEKYVEQKQKELKKAQPRRKPVKAQKPVKKPTATKTKAKFKLNNFLKHFLETIFAVGIIALVITYFSNR